MIMTSTAFRALAALAFLVLLLPSCSTEPQVEVEVGDSSSTAAPEGSQGGARLAEFGAPATQELPPGHPPMTGAAGSLAPVDPSAGTGPSALAWDTPPGWRSVPPSSSMRRAQYEIPSEQGSAECAVFYFGPGQGGDPMANAQRWASQFEQPDGRSSEEVTKTEVRQVGEVSVLLVETTGTYNVGPSMGGVGGAPMPGYALLGAVAQGPDANWFFKLTGPEAVVKAQRGSFEAMVESLRRGE